MTLEEYKAMQGKKEGPKFNLRKAGEGASIDPMWKNTRPCKAKRRDPSSTSVRLEKAPALTPCGRRPPLIRGKKKGAKRKKEKTRLNGTNALIARSASWTSTSRSPTRTKVAVGVEDVVAAKAVDADVAEIVEETVVDAEEIATEENGENVPQGRNAQREVKLVEKELLLQDEEDMEE